MASITTLAPLVAVAAFSLLSVLGVTGQAYNTSPLVRCAYKLGDLDAPAANVLLVGSSRIGRGLDPGYMMQRIKSKTGKNITVERLAMTRPKIPQFHPVLEHYLTHRSAPDYVVLQLLYNLDPDRQREWDVPVNSGRNIAFMGLGKMLELQNTAQLNDHSTVLPREFEAGYTLPPALALKKFTTTIYAGISYPAQKLLGKLDVCKGDKLYTQEKPNWLFNHIDDNLVFSENDAQKTRRLANEKLADGFLPLAASSKARRFETDQLHRLVRMAQEAGSTVYLLLMPSLGDIELTETEAIDIEMAFPNLPLLQPFHLFDSEIGAELAASFADTNHPTDFGALHYSRYLSDAISDLKF